MMASRAGRVNAGSRSRPAKAPIKKGDTQAEGDLSIAPIAATLQAQAEGDLQPNREAADNFFSRIHLDYISISVFGNPFSQIFSTPAQFIQVVGPMTRSARSFFLKVSARPWALTFPDAERSLPAVASLLRRPRILPVSSGRQLHPSDEPQL